MICVCLLSVVVAGEQRGFMYSPVLNDPVIITQNAPVQRPDRNVFSDGTSRVGE